MIPDVSAAVTSPQMLPPIPGTEAPSTENTPGASLHWISAPSGTRAGWVSLGHSWPLSLSPGCRVAGRACAGGSRARLGASSLSKLTFSPWRDGTESRRLWKLSLMWSLRLRSSALWCALLSACKKRTQRWGVRDLQPGPVGRALRSGDSGLWSAALLDAQKEREEEEQRRQRPR